MSIVSLQKIASHFSGIAELLTRVDLHAIEAVARAIRETQAAQRTVFTFGNGGSAATALHFANNLLSPKHGARTRVNCLMSNVSVISALANDIGYELIYSEQLRMLASPGDLAIAISVSGNSPNCVHGLQCAREMGLVTAALVGFDGGRLRSLSDYAILVPCELYPLVEDIHLVIAHAIASAMVSDADHA
jgi:D-sedoheptulose 7-phosphate isomerase